MVLREQCIEAMRFVRMPGCVFAQSVVHIKLPGALGKRVGRILACQLQQILVAPNNRGGSGKERGVHGFVENLFHATKQQVNISPDGFSWWTMPRQARQSA